MCWVQCLLDALSIRMRPASLVIPKKEWQDLLLVQRNWHHNRVVASHGSSEASGSLQWVRKPRHHGAATTWGSVFPIFDSLCDRIWLLYNDDTQRGGCLCMLTFINKYLAVKLTDNLISQSLHGRKIIILRGWVSHLPSFCVCFSKICALHYHVIRNPPSDWSRCVLKLSCQWRILSHSQNWKRHRSIWLQKLCQYSKFPNISMKIGSIFTKILQGVLKTPYNLLTWSNLWRV